MFGHRVTLLSLFGFRIYLDASWLILAAIVTWSLAAAYFPMVAPNLAIATHWWMALAGMLGLAASIVVHELAHAVVARHYRMPVGGITLFIFGGVAEMESEPEDAHSELWMALAGPIMSLAIAIVLLGGSYLLDMVRGPAWFAAQQVVTYLALANAVLAGFNMVPAFPLDGGRILRAALWAWRGDLLWATRLATGAGVIFAFVLMGVGIYHLVHAEFLPGLWWCFVGYFVRMAANRAYAMQVERSLLGGHGVERFLRPDAVTAAPDLPVTDLVENVLFGHLRRQVGVVENGRILGMVCVEDLKKAARGAWHFRRARSFMRAFPADGAIPLGASAATALAQFRRSGLQRLYVHADGIIQGEILLRDLLDYLALRMDLREPEVTRFVSSPRHPALRRDFG